MIRQFFAPDEFALRQWRAFRRLKGWRGVPVVFAATTAALLALGAAIFPIIHSEKDLFFLILQELVPFIFSIVVAVLWWTRRTNRKSLVEFSLTATRPLTLIYSSFRPAQVLLLLLMIFSTVILFLFFSTQNTLGDNLAPIIVIVIANMFYAWCDPLLCLGFLMLAPSTVFGTILCFLILFPLHFFIFFAILIIFNFELVNSPEEYAFLHFGVLMVYLVLVWLMRRALKKRMDWIVGKLERDFT